MTYAKWRLPSGSYTKFHAIALGLDGGFRFDQTTQKISSMSNPSSPLMTKCGRELPTKHVGATQLSLDEFNNGFCVTCDRANSL